MNPPLLSQHLVESITCHRAPVSTHTHTNTLYLTFSLPCIVPFKLKFLDDQLVFIPAYLDWQIQQMFFRRRGKRTWEHLEMSTEHTEAYKNVFKRKEEESQMSLLLRSVVKTAGDRGQTEGRDTSISLSENGINVGNETWSIRGWNNIKIVFGVKSLILHT